MRLVGLLTSAGAFSLGKTDFCKLHQAAGWLSRCGFVWGVSPEPVWVCSVCSCSVLPVCVSWVCRALRSSKCLCGLLDSTEVTQSKFNF